MSLPDLGVLTDAIRKIAKEEITPRFEKVGFEVKSDGSLLTEADLATNRRIQRFLQENWPDIAFLSEEMTLEEQEEMLTQSGSMWCLDPLDGTSNFAAGFPLFAVSLALFRQGEVVLALTYDPVRDEAFTAQKGQGAWLNGKPLRCQSSDFPLRKAVAMVDLKRMQPEIRQSLVNHAPYGSQRNIGTIALEWAWMTANRGQLYLHGSMKLWDYAAGSLLLSEAGGYACTLEGESVFRLSMQTRSAVASPDKRLFEEWFAYLQDLSAANAEAENSPSPVV
ncbi:MAG: inositol monophosphatase family protein [Thiolinea sp.]